MVQDGTNIDALVRKAVFGSEDEKAHARWMIWEMGQKAGVRPASIHELYMARGRGEVPAFTTPAMNVRIMSYDTGRAIFRAAKRLDAGAIICEIARSEIAYVPARGGASVLLTQASKHGMMAAEPRWSPDGSRIVFWARRSSDGDLWSMSSDGSGQTRLTSGMADDYSPDWSPDGTRLAFTRVVWFCGSCDEEEVFSMAVDGSDVRWVTTDTHYAAHRPSWSPRRPFRMD